MQAFLWRPFGRLRESTKRQLIAAGGIATMQEIDQLDAMKVDAVVGMAIYTRKIRLDGRFKLSQ
jgi:phosphoribosylformimino-5-aminoimidazole carboxamide ribotide isomerase